MFVFSRRRVALARGKWQMCDSLMWRLTVDSGSFPFSIYICTYIYSHLYVAIRDGPKGWQNVIEHIPKRVCSHFVWISHGWEIAIITVFAVLMMKLKEYGAGSPPSLLCSQRQPYFTRGHVCVTTYCERI